MTRSHSAIVMAALALVCASLLSFQASPRTATFAEVLKGMVGRTCNLGNGGPGVQLLVFGAPGEDPPKAPGVPKGFVFPRLDMVGEDFVRVSFSGRESWFHMSRITVQTTPK